MSLRRRIGVALITAAALVLSACGSTSLGGDETDQPGGAAPSVSQAADLADKLPDSIKEAGKIMVGTDATYAPNEFFDTDGTTIVGFDIDLFDAIAAKFGVTAEYTNGSFDSIIPGVNSGKFDVGVSSFTINAERMQQVHMVSYFNAGTQWATAKGNPKGISIDNPCGLTISVQTNTVQQLDDLPARQEACGSNPMKILPFDDQNQATNAVINGRADAMLADSPVTAYAVQQTGDKLELLGDIYDSAPYGITVNKEQSEFAAALVEALQQLQADGTYDQILTKWGVEAGGITDFAVDPTL